MERWRWEGAKEEQTAHSENTEGPLWRTGCVLELADGKEASSVEMKREKHSAG